MKKILSIFILALLAGCSGKPSDGDIERQVTSEVLSDGGDQIYRVENFQKLNGFEKDEKTYVAEVKYDLVFKKSIKEIEQQLEQEAEKSPLRAFGKAFETLALRVQYGNFEAGYRAVKKDQVTFVKSDNGWVINGSDK